MERKLINSSVRFRVAIEPTHQYRSNTDPKLSTCEMTGEKQDSRKERLLARVCNHLRPRRKEYGDSEGEIPMSVWSRRPLGRSDFFAAPYAKLTS